MAVVVVLLLFAQSAQIFAAPFEDRSGAYEACAAQLDAVSAPDDLVVIGTTSPAVDRGTANNHQEPTIFYLAERKGWSLPADRYSSSLLQDHAAQGAKYFVDYDPSLVPPGSEIAGWLASDAVQVRSSVANGCDIWMHRPVRRA